MWHFWMSSRSLESWFILGPVFVFGTEYGVVNRGNWGITNLLGMKFATISGPRVIRAPLTNIEVGST